MPLAVAALSSIVAPYGETDVLPRELRLFTHDMWWEVQGCFLRPPNYAGA